MSGRLSRSEPQATLLRAWTATWAINEVPTGYEVIRDGRGVGIGRCDNLEGALEAIRLHPLYDVGDHVVRHRDEQGR